MNSSITLLQFTHMLCRAKDHAKYRNAEVVQYAAPHSTAPHTTHRHTPHTATQTAPANTRYSTQHTVPHTTHHHTPPHTTTQHTPPHSTTQHTAALWRTAARGSTGSGGASDVFVVARCLCRWRGIMVFGIHGLWLLLPAAWTRHSVHVYGYVYRHVYGRVYRHVCGRVLRHVHRHVYRNGYRHVYRHVPEYRHVQTCAKTHAKRCVQTCADMCRHVHENVYIDMRIDLCIDICTACTQTCVWACAKTHAKSMCRGMVCDSYFLPHGLGTQYICIVSVHPILEQYAPYSSNRHMAFLSADSDGFWLFVSSCPTQSPILSLCVVDAALFTTATAKPL